MKIVLASGSPRRAKILKDLGVDFEVVKTDAPEVSYPADPERTVRENALAKGAAARPVPHSHPSSDRLRGSLRSGDTSASLRLCVKISLRSFVHSLQWRNCFLHFPPQILQRLAGFLIFPLTSRLLSF